MSGHREKELKQKEQAMKKKAKDNNDLFREKPQYPKQELNLVLPLCPSVNHIYKFVKGKRFLTKTAIQYIKTVQDIVTVEKIKQGYKMEGQGVWLVAELTFYFPDRRRRDCHNTHKLLADSLEGEAFIDDRYLLIRDMDVFYSQSEPRIEVKIKAR